MKPWAWLLVLACGCGGDDAAGPDASAADARGPDADPDQEVCPIAAGDGVSFDPAAEPGDKLSSSRFFTDAVAQAPSDGVVPYDLNSALFSDYTTKYRFVWLPAGATMPYATNGVFDIPVGAVLIKTFAYLDDLGEPAGGRTLLETRLLVHRADGWEGLTYVWDEAQTEAYRTVAGAVIPSSWIHSDGEDRSTNYLVPNTNQCKECHENAEVMSPVGLKAMHLNRDFDHGDGPVNQLAHLTEIGYLTGAPADPADAPRLPVFDDPATGTVDERARAWLDINCAHCHNPVGPARTSGLDLSVGQTDPYKFGICKAPIAAGPGTGGFQYSIVPGDPDTSIMVFRLESTVPSIQMPELGRTLVHDEGVALIRAWITGLEPAGCGAE